MTSPHTRYRLVLFLIIAVLLGACTAPNPTPAAETDEPHADEAVLSLPDISGITVANGEKLRVVVTTSIIGDVVRNIAGDNIELTVLMAQGQDPHSYQPTPQDLTTASRAQIVFVNGWDLEEGLINDLTNAVDGGVIVPVSAGIEPLSGEADEHEVDADHAEAEGEEEHHHAHDPHVWFDPNKVMVWVDNITQVLTKIEPDNMDTYTTNAEAYKGELTTLDTYIKEQVAQIPEANRKLVTNHDTFSYFAQTYGFEIIGTVLPSASTGTEPSAADLADLVKAINTSGVKAVFIENTVGESLADVVADETGATVYELYTDALGAPGSGADTYLTLMRTDVDTIVQGLR